MSLDKAEKADNFFRKVAASPANTLARQRCSYTLWNDQSLAKKAAELLHPDDKAFVSVVILNPSAEGGMPHTRPGLICLPAYFPDSQLEETMRHEMIHISQKRQPSLWNTRAEMEGWKQVKDTDIPSEWLSRCRLNPDTASARFFAWQGRHVPLPLFIREDKPEIRDVQVRWYDMAEGIVKSRPPTSFTEIYGTLGSSSAEHPYELWAYHRG
jgi:hypothetical protein